MDWVQIIIAVIAVLAVILSSTQFFADRSRNKARDEFEERTTNEAAETQRRLLDIEEARHLWEREDREAGAAEAQLAEDQANTANVLVRFGFRDSARSWGRVIATNNGPADAPRSRFACSARTLGSRC